MENIYELLNYAEMNVEEFENQTLSSYESKIAKKKISKEIRKLQSSKKPWKKTFAAAAACTWVMIGIGSISAATGWMPIPDAFQTIFGIQTDEELEAANTIGTSTHVVAENHGYKISAEGIMGDGKNVGIVFQIEKSDGSALLRNGKAPSSVDFLEFGSEDCLHGMSGTIEDSNQAGSIGYYIAFTFQDNVENHVFISLEDMQLWNGDERINVSGKWEFDIPFEVQSSSVNLAAGQKFEYGNSKGTIDELMISPIGFSVQVTTTDQLSDSDFIDMPMEIHLKNGEVVELYGGCGPEYNEDGTWTWRQDGVYEKLILLDRIESVMVGDTKFEMK